MKEYISKRELDKIENFLDKLFKKFELDIEFTHHFYERLNDPRNGKRITGLELILIFRRVYEKYGKDIALKPDDFQGVLKDLSTDLNIPFVLNYDDVEGDIDLVAKTIMRKHNFRTSNRKYSVNK
jgi:hypothetical protein